MKAALNHIGASLRILGDIGNLVILGGFLWATLVLKGLAVSYYHSAGPLPQLSREGLEAMLADPQRAVQLWHLAAAWAFAVAAAGTAWMTLLGARWTYHFLLRLMNR